MKGAEREGEFSELETVSQQTFQEHGPGAFPSAEQRYFRHQKLLKPLGQNSLFCLSQGCDR